MNKYLRVAISCLCFTFCSADVSIAKEWRGIVPLHSTREDVRRLLGKPLPISSTFDDSFDVDEGRVNIMYVRKKCEQGLPADWGNWNVPPYTVANIEVSFNKEIKPSELNIDLEKYKWYTDDSGATYYHDKKEGLLYSVNRLGFLDSITYGPTEADQHLLCKKDAPEIRY